MRKPACAIDDHASSPTPSFCRSAPMLPRVIVRADTTAINGIQMWKACGRATARRMNKAPSAAAFEIAER